MFDGNPDQTLIPTAAKEGFELAEAALRRFRGLDTNDWGNAQRAQYLEHVERIIRAAQGLGHTALNQLREVEEAQRAEGKRGRLKLRDELANTLNITPAEATGRIEEAKHLGICTVGGKPQALRLPEAAQAQLEGRVGQGHLKILIGFNSRLTENVNPEQREKANRELAEYAVSNRPDALRVWANAKAQEIDPLDSPAKANRRALRRSLSISAQDEDGMSRISGRLTPELRVLLDAHLDQPSRLQDEHDDCTFEQRTHDALEVVLRNIGEGKTKTVLHLYAHASLDELQKTGVARDMRGNRTPIWNLLKQASTVIPYLVLFKDKARKIPLDLWRGARIANGNQRAVLGIQEGGCTAPGCGVSAAHCEVHHLREWRKGGFTNIQNLTLVCDHHHHLLDEGWQTTRINGIVHWTAPPETTPRANTHHRQAVAA